MLPIDFVLSCTKVWEFSNLPWNSVIEKIITFWCNGIYSRKIIVCWTLLMVNPQHLVIKYVHKKQRFATFKDHWHVYLKVCKIWNSFSDKVDSDLHLVIIFIEFYDISFSKIIKFKLVDQIMDALFAISLVKLAHVSRTCYNLNVKWTSHMFITTFLNRNILEREEIYVGLFFWSSFTPLGNCR